MARAHPPSGRGCVLARLALASAQLLRHREGMPGQFRGARTLGAAAVVVCPSERGESRMRMKGLFVAIALVAAPTLASAQHEHPPANAAVDFGVLPAGPTGVLVPIGPLPCLQAGAIGGPAIPAPTSCTCLTPEETTIAKGGQVTFQVHGGGHGFAIYEVSKDTTREDLGQFLCAGTGSGRDRRPDAAPLQPAGGERRREAHRRGRPRRRRARGAGEPRPTRIPTIACGPSRDG